MGSIPIHPRHFSAILAAMTAKMTAKTTNGFLNRLRPLETPAVDCFAGLSVMTTRVQNRGYRPGTTGLGDKLMSYVRHDC